MIGRRSFIAGLASLIAAPAIVRAANIMPVRSVIIPPEGGAFLPSSRFITSGLVQMGDLIRIDGQIYRITETYSAGLFAVSPNLQTGPSDL